MTNEYDKIIKDSVKEHIAKKNVFYSAKVSNLDIYAKINSTYSDAEKVNFIIYCIETVHLKTAALNKNYDSDESNKRSVLLAYINQFFKSKLLLKDIDLERIIAAIFSTRQDYYFHLKIWSLPYLINLIEKQYQGKDLSDLLKKSLNSLKSKISDNNNYLPEKDKLKLSTKIDAILFEKSSADEVMPILFAGEDNFSDFANEIICQKAKDERQTWYKLVAKTQKATGGKPSQKYLTESKKIIDEIGAELFYKTVNEWIVFIINLEEEIEDYLTDTLLSAVNTEAIKGFVWMCSLFYDKNTIQNISKLAERCYKKIPGKGPAAPGIGNACFFTLFNSEGLDGIGQLSRLRLKIKQPSAQSLIVKYISEAATKLGITTDEIEDLAVDDLGLVEGKKEYQIEGYTCALEIIGIGKSTQRWFKPDQSEQKSVPAFVKENHAAQLKEIKDCQKQIDQTTSAQKDRIDRMLRGNREMTLDYFKKNYLEHGLMSFLAKKIIFNFIKDDQKIEGLYLNNNWKTNDNQIIKIENFSKVSLWHPATSSTENVQKWRAFLIQHEVLQPIKQAFREIYILTDAEIRTRTYSNRMAAHVLKQHQYVTLAKGRSWSARLMGSWDGGYSDTAMLKLPEYDLCAEFWVDSLNADGAVNDTGVWNYITTDQIRFTKLSNQSLVNLVDIPIVVFSEVLRDVDLFVGVASVGNDPTWRDSGGLPAHRDYWQSYSFGDLSETAKNRKEILQNLIPRLKIAKVTSIEDKFVVVKGKLRTYKIHIGSTNILMMPNDQYLCIVPDRSQKDHTNNIFLPFEGDSGLSVILSKAFLLAEDDKISDSTITSQINRK